MLHRQRTCTIASVQAADVLEEIVLVKQEILPMQHMQVY